MWHPSVSSHWQASVDLGIGVIMLRGFAMSHEAVNEDLAEWKIGDWAEYAGTRCLVIDVRGQLIDVVRRVGSEWEDRFAGIHRSVTNALYDMRVATQIDLKPLPGCTGWDWQPEPTYRPFANAIEFAPNAHRLIEWNGSYQAVRRFNDSSVSTSAGFSYEDLLKACRFADLIDGKFVYFPCGVEVSE